jgi:RNA polymerase-binding protein DksA
MVEIDLAYWKGRLEDERARMEGELAEMQREVIESADPLDPQRGGVGNHFADDATELEQQETALSLRRNSDHLLAQVNHALARVADGTYGHCERCGKVIPVERLEARPYATFCVEDQAREEQFR